MSSYVKAWELNRQDAKIAKGSDDTFADDQSEMGGRGRLSGLQYHDESGAHQQVQSAGRV
ncbi:MAG: hypothetical protein PHF14_04395 [Verrucomicrobiota bacterium]|nr:hypothetical protein [Verrucomicrobiota bacterium]